MAVTDQEALEWGDSLLKGVVLADRVARLLKAGMKNMPPTDLRADALEAADQLLAWCDQVRA